MILADIDPRRRGNVVEQQVRIAGDRREHVVHVVRDTGRQRPDRLHPLRVHQLVLQPTALLLGSLELGELMRELSRGLGLGEAVNLAIDQRAPHQDLHGDREHHGGPSVVRYIAASGQ